MFVTTLAIDFSSKLARYSWCASASGIFSSSQRQRCAFAGRVTAGSGMSRAVPPFGTKNRPSNQKVKWHGFPWNDPAQVSRHQHDGSGASSRPNSKLTRNGSCAFTGRTQSRAKSLLSSNRRQNLSSFNSRIAEFIIDRFPNEGSPVELLCVDHNGTYVVPYPCGRVEDAWRNLETNEIIEADVAGWRPRGGKHPGESA
jgi:hypothetical protein